MSKILINDIKGLYDEDLKTKLDLFLKNNDKLDIVLRNKTVFISVNNEFKFKGELYKECEKLIFRKENISKVFLWEAQTISNELYSDFKVESQNFNYLGDLTTKLNQEKLSTWIKKSHARNNLPDKAKNEILVLSKQRCQICGKNLDSDTISKKIGKGLADYGQIAHIEGAGFDGPRANINKENCDDVENLMLLCYGCHREIDFIRPDDFSVDYLKAVKKDQENTVSALLDSLQNSAVFPFKILGSLYPNDKTTINNFEIATALKKAGFRPPELPCPEDLFKVPQSTDRPSEVHSSFYWQSMFKVIQNDMRIFNSYFERSQKHYNSKGVGLFCYHGISELILLGRLIGDSSSITLFQKHRDANHNFFWEWPNQNDKSNNSDIEFESQILRPKNETNEKEALLIIEVSGTVKEESLPNYLYENITYLKPTLKIQTNKQNKEVTAISTQESLQKFKMELYSAINTIQDKWNCSKIHIINISPTSTNVVIGQSLQDRHHSEIICYERNKDTQKQEPTIGIDNKKAYFYSESSVYLSFNKHN